MPLNFDELVSVADNYTEDGMVSAEMAVKRLSQDYTISKSIGPRRQVLREIYVRVKNPDQTFDSPVFKKSTRTKRKTRIVPIGAYHAEHSRPKD